MDHLRLAALTRPVVIGQLVCALVGLALSGLAIGQALAMSALFSSLVTGGSLAALTTPFLALCAVLLARPAVTALREISAHAVAGRMKRVLRRRLLDAAAARGPFAGAQESVGARQSLLVDGVENLEPYVTRYIPQIVVTTVGATIAIAILVIVDPVVGIAAALAALVVPLIPRLWDRVLRAHGDAHWAAYSGMHADVVDSMRGMETLKLLGASGRRRAQLRAASADLLSSTLRQLRLSLVESGLTGLLLVAGPAIVLAVGVARVWSGTLAPEDLFVVTLVGFEVFRPFRELANHWHAGYVGLSAGRRILEALADDAHAAPTAAERPAPSDPDLAIELSGVDARYPGADMLAVRDLHLGVRRGSFTAIVGASGAGKSTIGDLILGVLAPERGTVAIDAGGGSAPVALVSQDPVLFSGSLRENLRAVAPLAADHELEHALRTAQASDLISDGSGLDREVGESGGLLSGGQRQRVAVARALLQHAPILLLDEGTSALDGRRERDLVSALSGLPERRTLVVIAHRLSAIETADEVVVVGDGRVLERGAYADLAAGDGPFARLAAAQREGIPA
ncbi:ABC transporter ATP-binding protein/permease [Microbacterium karelineae]|uniref:ABC transporter ATP-binding protein/permease n=1 Tax=Microbacterium karelineae TaxID=2654283 RepID=UPI0012EA0583|nr:ATP-binding cassette domain-containing protein [Microbacterium karelineae]